MLALFVPAFDSIRFLLACIVAGLTLFALGTLKTALTSKNWLRNGLESVLVGGLAASIAYGIGVLLSSVAE